MHRFLLSILLLLPILLLSALAVAGEEQTADPELVATVVKQLASRDVDERLGAAQEAARIQDKQVTTPLVKLLKDKNPAIRIAAIDALGLRKQKDDQKRASKALAARIARLAKRPEDKAELLRICSALHDLAQPNALKALLDYIPPDADREVATARLRAAANIPSKEVIDELLKIASAGRRGGAQWRRKEALRQLRYATQAKVRGDVPSWRRWWTENKRTYDPDIAANQRADARLKQQEQGAKRKKRKKKKAA